MRAELAGFESKISQFTLEKPLQVMQTGHMDQKAGDAMIHATKLIDFLTIMEDICKDNHQFRSATVTIE